MATDWDQALQHTGEEGRRTANAARDLIRRLDPEVVEVVWPHQGTIGFGIGPRKMGEHYAYLAIHAGHVNLGFYRGTAIPDPAGLLQGGGKAMRHIPLHGPDDLGRPEIAELLREARDERVSALKR